MSNTVTKVQSCLKRLQDGDTQAAKEVVVHALERLRFRAHQILRPGDRVHNELPPTALLDDAFNDIVRVILAMKPLSYDDFLRLASKKLREKMLDYGRILIRQPRGTGGDPAPDVSGSATSPSTRVARREFLEAVERLVTGLEPRQRCILYYLDVVCLTQKETAQRLAVDESTVKRAYRALKPQFFDLMASHLLGGDLPPLSDEEKREAYDAGKSAVLDLLWGDCQAELESLSPEDTHLIDLRWCWGASETEAAEGLKMDLNTFREKWEQIVARLSPMLRDLLKE